jgi:hypothetical protein
MLMHTWASVPAGMSGVHDDKDAALDAAASALDRGAFAVLVAEAWASLNPAAGYSPTGQTWTGRREGGKTRWRRHRLPPAGDGREAVARRRIALIEASTQDAMIWPPEISVSGQWEALGDSWLVQERTAARFCARLVMMLPRLPGDVPAAWHVPASPPPQVTELTAVCAAAGTLPVNQAYPAGAVPGGNPRRERKPPCQER